MASDPKRLQEVYKQIAAIKAASHPRVVSEGERYEIVERPWREVREPSKLAILQDAVDWSGVTNRDRGHILLGEIDVGKVTDSQRIRLIEMATDRSDYEKMLGRAAQAGAGRGRDDGLER